MNSYPKQLYIALFLTQVLSIFGLRMVQTNLFNAIVELPFYAGILGTTLYLGSRYAFRNNKEALEIQKFPLAIGLALFIPTMMIESLFTALLLLGFFMLAAFNITLNSRKQISYVLGATFVIFLYAISNSFKSIFLFIAIAFVFAFIAVLVQEYYISRTHKEQKIDEKYSGLGIGISLVVLVLASLLYLFVPRLDAINLGFLYAGGNQFYEDQNLKDQAKFQKKEDMTPVQLPNKKQDSSSHPLEPTGTKISNALLLYVRSDTPVYLRGSVYDRLEGNQWVQTLYANNIIQLKEDHFKLSKDITQKDENRVTVFHTKDSPKNKIIYTPHSPSVLEFPGNIITRDAYSTLYAPKVIEDKSFYSTQVSLNKFDSRTILNTELHNKEAYLQIPDSVTPRLTTLAKEVTTQFNSPYEKAKALEKFLYTNYNYTIETVFHSYDGDILETFLFDKKYGHCEYFATSMTMMLRSIGVPSRLVTGYVASTYNPLTGYYEVRPINGHAWSEAWIEPFGWIMFEPTPGYNINQRSQETSPAKMIEGYLQELENSDIYESTIYGQIKQIIQTLREVFEKGFDFIHSNIFNLLGIIVLGLLISFIWYAISPFIWSKLSTIALQYIKIRYKGFNKQCQMFNVAQHHLRYYNLHRKESMTFEEYMNLLKIENIATEEERSSLVRHMNHACYGDKSKPYEKDLFESTLNNLVKLKRSRKHPLISYFSKLFS